MSLKPMMKGDMGKCKFCGKNAGILRDAHAECKLRNTAGTKHIFDSVRSAASNSAFDLKQLEKELYTIADTNFVQDYESNRSAFSGWQYAVNDAITEEEFTKEKYETLTRLANLSQLSGETISASKVWSKFMAGRRTKLQQEAILERELRRQTAERKRQEEAARKRKQKIEEAERHGRILLQSIIEKLKNGRRIEPNISIEDVPFILQKSEQLVWTFADTEYLQEHVVRRRSPQSNTKYAMKLVDRGTMGVTTKHIYFVGEKERFRIRYDRIVAFKEYYSSIGLTRGAASARHERFVTGDGWFTYNLVSTLAKLY